MNFGNLSYISFVHNKVSMFLKGIRVKIMQGENVWTQHVSNYATKHTELSNPKSINMELFAAIGITWRKDNSYKVNCRSNY